MGKNIKSASKYVLIIAMLAGFMLKNASTKYQLIFLGIVIATLPYEMIRLKRIGEDINKVYTLVAASVCFALVAFVVIGRSYLNMDEMTQIIILLFALGEFILVSLIFKFRSAISKGDKSEIRQCIIGTSMMGGLILLIGLVVLFN